MKSEGSAGSAVMGSTHLPLPMYGTTRKSAPTRPRPTGLNWDATRPAAEATAIALERTKTRACKGCGNATPVDELRDRYCPVCTASLEERFHDADAQLGRELAALGGDRLDDAILHAFNPDDHAPPPTSDEVEKPEPAGPDLRMAIAHLRAARDGLTAELHRIDVTLALLLAETPASPAVAPAPTAPRAAPQTRRRRSNIDASEAVRRYQDGDTVPTIAKALGCTPKRIYAALDEARTERRDDRHGHSGGGNRKQPTDDDPQLVANVRRLYFDEDLGQLEVAQALGIGVKRVQNLMARHQMQVRPPASAPGAPGRLTLEQRADVVRLYGEGESTGTLSKRFGISPPSIRKILLREGVTLRSHREAAAVGRQRAARG